MSEKLHGHEHHEKHDHTHEHHEAAKTEVNHANLEKQRQDQLEASRETIQEHAERGHLLAAEKEDDDSHTKFATHQLLKKDSYKQLLKQTQQRLPAISRQFSKVIHQKQVETISTFSAQTVARPSALLGGGIGALAGSVLLLYLSKHYGFTYNYAFFFVTFACGFAAGLLLELLVRVVKRNKN